jgi:DNA repair exonuclease SbcCD ATPase subunit
MLSTLPLVRPVNSHPRPQSSHSSTARRPTNIDNILQEFNNVKHRLTNLEKLLNTDSRKTESDGNFQKFDQVLGNLQGQQIIIQELKILKEKINEENQRIDELDRQSKLHNDQPGSSNIDKQQIENFIQTSTVIKELRDRSLILETSFRNLSTGLTQEAIDQAIRISEKKAIDREQIIENLARGTDDKIKLMETQLAQLLARLEKLPSSITYADAHQLIQNEIQNFIQTQPDNNEWQNLAREAIYKVNYLENQLNDFFQSTKDNSPRPIVTEPVERPILIQKPVTKANDNFEQRLNDLERRLNNIPSPPNLGLIEQRLTQLEKYPPNRNDQRIATLEDQIRDISGHLQSIQKQIDDLDKRKLERGEIPPRHDDIEQRLQQQLQNLSDTVMGHLKTKPDHQMVNRLIQDSEERINQQLNALQQLVTENQHALKNMKNYLNDLYQQLNQQLPKIPKLPDKLKPEEDPVIHKPTLEELQTIMPFIELLPTFDMLNENEWI